MGAGCVSAEAGRPPRAIQRVREMQQPAFAGGGTS